MNKSLEIDFLAVGNGEKSGDAIAFRYGDFTDPNKQKVIVIDGGTKESGKELCTLIKSTYHTNTIDLVVCTHPDGDHASGLTEVLG
ncbi:MBL fold metallo-hydrolase, partial [Xanthomarina sp.]|uniref:MBL fold metallo-hydrolase n=1 Tax=Xanthomarina sp. TaxID=1931211 RepID=UPI002BDC95E9